MYKSSITPVVWEECAEARKEVKRVEEKQKRGMWEDVVNETNYDGGMK